jgi:hypothetical protein
MINRPITGVVICHEKEKVFLGKLNPCAPKDFNIDVLDTVINIKIINHPFIDELSCIGQIVFLVQNIVNDCLTTSDMVEVIGRDCLYLDRNEETNLFDA